MTTVEKDPPFPSSLMRVKEQTQLVVTLAQLRVAEVEPILLAEGAVGVFGTRRCYGGTKDVIAICN